MKYFAICLLLFMVNYVVGNGGQPNIVMIVADDLGFNDVSFHGCPQIPTPNLDKLANSGIILNNYYVLPNCSPTRSALLTGRYPINTGMQSGTIYGANAWGIGLKEKLLPQYLKKAGYKTHAVGKWHLGFAYKEYTPTHRGFDTFFGFYGGQGDYWDHSFASNGYWGLDLHRDTPDKSEPVWTQWGNYSSEMFSTEAIDRINEHNKKDPMFLYLSYQAVHSANQIEAPLQAPQKWINKFQHIKNQGRRKYAAMVAAMDDGVGRVYRALKRRNMVDNTIIIFTSDNGGPANGLNMNWATNYPLRGAKTTVFEGGVRAAGFIHSPILLRDAHVSNAMMHATDWLPTLLNLIGEKAQMATRKIDGFNIWNTLQNREESPRTEVLINIDPLLYKNAALRIGDWKLVNQSRFYDGWYRPPGLKRMQQRYLQKLRKNSNRISKNTGNLSRFWSGKRNARIKCGPIPDKVPHCGGRQYKPCLFNVKDDPCEYRDLSDQFPIIYEIMLRRLGEYRRKMAKPRMVTYRDPRANPKRWKGVWTPWKIHPKVLKQQKKEEEEEENNKKSSIFNIFGKFPYSLKCGFAKR